MKRFNTGVAGNVAGQCRMARLIRASEVLDTRSHVMVAKNRKWEIILAGAVAAAMASGGWAATSRADITNGFSSSANWALNGNTTATGLTPSLPAIASGDLELTSGKSSEATSAWYTTTQDVAASWTASFTWQYSNRSSGNWGDGFMFVVQTAGTSTLGGSGSSKGYATATDTSSESGYSPVTPSVGIGFELYNKINLLTFGENGGALSTAPSTTAFNTSSGTIMPNGSTSTLTVNTGSSTTGKTINFTITYDSSTNQLGVLAVDSANSSDFFDYTGYVSSPTASILADLGQSTGYVGFTGGTGGANMQQDVTNFDFTTVPEPAPLAIFAVGGGLGLLLIGRKRTARRTS